MHRRGRTRRRLAGFGALLVLALSFAACQTPPRPFQSLDPVQERPLANPAAPSGLLVRAVVGAPAARELAEAVAEALRRREVAAATGRGNVLSWLLTGRAEARPADLAGYLDVRLDWQLADTSGRERLRFDQNARVAEREWRTGRPELLRRLADEAAIRLAPAFADAHAPDLREKVVTIYAIDGAPGDGAASLRQALGVALTRRGFRLSEAIADGGIVIAGTVRLSPGGREGDTVAILWTALAPDGATLGTVEQSNRVPAGSLSGPWGMAAVHVAEAAAPGIARLIARAEALAKTSR